MIQKFFMIRFLVTREFVFTQKEENIIYIYYVNENGSYIITDVYKDKLNMPDTDYVTAMAASRVKAVSMMFRR